MISLCADCVMATIETATQSQSACTLVRLGLHAWHASCTVEQLAMMWLSHTPCVYTCVAVTTVCFSCIVKYFAQDKMTCPVCNTRLGPMARQKILYGKT